MKSQKKNPGMSAMKSSPRPMPKPSSGTAMKSSPRPMPAGPARAQFMLDRQARVGDGYKDGGCVMAGRGGKYKGMK
ncbi:hypothetical protein UFOVP330_75 [uncultured Caudovirales phage]|uniref:Uncharacterized protein n=1 Tax=uncultured Caudovirales phage TaxID=2100421 RepID=A0A6J5LZ59_9CAUD|nr:hypothetical protein UFOVP330_75 [uncultured Caudovirales phage]